MFWRSGTEFCRDGRRLDPVHAYDDAGHFDRGIAKAVAAYRSNRDELPGSRSRSGQTGRRADTATDPAPLSDARDGNRSEAASEWRDAHTWYSNWAPDGCSPLLRHVTADHISEQELVREMRP